MVNHNYIQVLAKLKYLNESFFKYQEQGKKAINAIHARLEEGNIKCNLSDKGELSFEIFNKKFIIRSEIGLIETGKFSHGEIVTYCVINMQEEFEVLKSKFDDIGNHEGLYLVNGFSEHYLTKFFHELVKLSNEGKIKFPL